MNNILSKYKVGDVRAFPFPHIIIEEAFSKSEYDVLSKSYPDTSIIGSQKEKPTLKNQRIQLCSKDFENNPNLLDFAWNECYEAHTNEEFYQDFLRLFSKYLRKYYGAEIEEKLTNYSSLGKRDVSENEINLDFQPGINTPPRRIFRKTVRGPHIDNPKEIFAGLVYFRTNKDLSIGGDLEICSIKKDLEFYGKMEIPRSKVKSVQKLKYKENSGIFFLNSPITVHSVTNRSYTQENRKLLNIIGETNFPLFEIHKGSGFSSKLRRKFYQTQANLGFNL